MISCPRFAIATSALVLVAACSTSAFASFHPHLTPLKQLGHVGHYLPRYVAPKSHKSGKWKDIKGALPFQHGPWGPMQLTDGTVLILDYCDSPGQWYKLTPDSKGNYTTGTWSKIAAMPSGYSPLFYASQILADGRLIVNGGEYNHCSAGWTNQGALYDPVANSWTSVPPPSGWQNIGDAPSVILPDGNYMLADCCTSDEAIATISGTNVTWTATGSGKGDFNSEEGWTNLPGGDLLTVDATNAGYYELYDTATGTWSTPGKTPDLLVNGDLGPAVLRPDGTVIQFTANSSAGENDLYDTSSGTWTSGPIMKVGSTIYVCDDAPAALLPDGNVLVQASPGPFTTPSHFWEFSRNAKGAMKLTQVNDPAQGPNTASPEGTMLVLPTGQVLWTNSQNFPNEVAVYTPKGKPEKSWLPKVQSVETTLTVGSTGNAISGTNFNGFSQGGSYGDDAQMSTNYPLVRITNGSTGDVCFARSYNFSTMGVWTTGTTNAEFDIPSSCETGASKLQVIVNGLASQAVSVTLN